MMSTSSDAQLDPVEFIRSRIRTVPNWPQPGVMFRDITPLLQSAKALRVLVDLFVERYVDAKLDYIAGLDARGFIIAPIVAYELSVGFVPIRKAGKLPYKTQRESYALEYGTAAVEIHEDACRPGERVVIVDDLIATGGTMLAGKNLLERLGAVVVEGAAIVDLPDLGGSALLRQAGLPLYTVTEFSGH
ncbi:MULTISPECIES: adenine phosphoribosyltransferase [Burkholderia]|uniref:Adenine phosphoribosyltransferase n=1 Tax=Burkholderia savannae TaxID=1637837 RepID=A0ABR5TGS5_9BURK|nr:MULTISPECIES: adenine phosphoribosyltransferase [Burkholderia]KVK81117.1 adenine phosphoribosyltransferase [Burkholderia sp. MSMB1498]KWZ44188.1 adenine phosphoribosyltransferase [Burkholderia savannae]